MIVKGGEKNVIITGIKEDAQAESNARKVLKKLVEETEDCKISVLPTANAATVIIVELPTEEKKKKALEKRRNATLTYQNCVIDNSPNKIYVNEDLQRPTREIFKKARELRKDRYKFVWCKEGQIYVRKLDGEAVVRIHFIRCSETEVKPIDRKCWWCTVV
nr:unnamed protein product [Callosobruchus analis]